MQQVVKASLKEKTLGLNIMERRATTTNKALELDEQKANDASSRLGETKLNLTKTASLLFTRDKELTDDKGGEKAQK